jgi:endoglucanase
MKEFLMMICLILVILTGCQIIEVAEAPMPTSQPASSPAPLSGAHAQAQALGRGINLGNALEAPREGEWGVTLQETYFPLIRDAGFDTVRVPIRWSSHAQTTPPYTIDETFFTRVDWVIANAFEQDLNVVINMHHYDEIFEDPDGHTERFLEMWKQIATRYKDEPATLYFEPLNEPHGNLNASQWNNLLKDVIHVIRTIDQGKHTLIVGGADWGGINGLKSLKIPEEEKNVIATFHYYDPMLFTHQGAEWMADEYGTLGVEWPGPPETKLEPIPEARKVEWVRLWFMRYNQLAEDVNPASPKYIAYDLDKAVAWREEHDIPLWLGEFGAYSKADMPSRVRWTATMRQEAEARGISWAYWEFCAGFGVYDQDTQQWNEGLLNALVPQE